jgi:hypothetical protein
MVATVVEELSFERKVITEKSCATLLKALIEIWKRSVPPPHIIPVAMVILKFSTSTGKGNKSVAFVSIFATLNFPDVIESTTALLAVIEPLATTSPVISTIKGIKLASSIIISPSLII